MKFIPSERQTVTEEENSLGRKANCLQLLGKGRRGRLQAVEKEQETWMM